MCSVSSNFRRNGCCVLGSEDKSGIVNPNGRVAN